MKIPPLLLAATLPLGAVPAWKAPPSLALGELTVLELREDDPARPGLPRPGEEKLGPLALRSVEPTPDGRGWRLTVQPLGPGLAVIPPMDLGDGRKSPELRLAVPRTVPFAAPWMGVGGGREDVLPYVPFPWAWASLALLPLAALAALILWRWRRAAPGRVLHRARKAFAHAWPPLSHQREALDAAHAAGRNLLAAHFGEASRTWGAAEFKARRLEPWDTWIQSLDAARFARQDPPFPSAKPLLESLGPRKTGGRP